MNAVPSGLASAGLARSRASGEHGRPLAHFRPAMSLSLRDQLLQAGLLDPKKAQQQQQQTREQRHQRREQTKKTPTGPDPRVLAQQKAAAEKAARDAELNRKQQDKQDQKARRAQVKQLIEQHRVPKITESEELYNFVDGKRIRRLLVDRPMREKLIAGTWVIVRCDGRYEIVPSDIATRIVERDPHAALKPAAAGESGEAAGTPEDDPYRDHKVPDDLMW